MRGQPPAVRRAALVQMMKHDQDVLAVYKRRHVDGMYKQAQNRGAINDAPHIVRHRLIGRNETV